MLCNLPVALTGPEHLGQRFPAGRIQQAAFGGQGFPDVRVDGGQRFGQKVGDMCVPLVLAQKVFKPLLRFLPENRIPQPGRQKLHMVGVHLGNLAGTALQKHLVTLPVSRGQRVAGGYRFLHRHFCGGNGFHVRHNLPDERVVVQLFGIHHLTVRNPARGQDLPDGDGVDIVKLLLLRFGVEAIFLDELRDPALNLGPGQHRSFGAVRADCERGASFAAVKLMGQPCGGVFLPSMFFHVANNSAFALDIAVPVLDGLVDVRIRERTQQLMEFGIGLVDDFPRQALPELGDMGIEMKQFLIAR